MIQRLQKIFHTDKWWGRLLFLFLFNLLFFLLGILIYNLFFITLTLNINILQNVFFDFTYLFILLPILSSVFIYKIWQKINITFTKTSLFFINLLIIIFIFVSYFIIAYFSIRPSFF